VYKDKGVFSAKSARRMDWLLRLLKGALIGTGFILPGVSGGALAAVFGLYERIIGFIAHVTKDFIANVLFFIPVGVGALLGMFLLSRPLVFLLEHYEAQVLWGFAGCIIGTLHALWQEAGKHGRARKHYGIMAGTALGGFAFLWSAAYVFKLHLPLNIFTWLFAGILIALGVLVPGMSPSNFLVYLDMYKPMVDAFKSMNLWVLIPILAGALVCLLSLSAVMDRLFKKAYAGIFHGVFGIVIASTVMIIPFDYHYASIGTLGCAGALVLGSLLGFWMSRLEEKYT
jgi:putative membrane protein